MRLLKGLSAAAFVVTVAACMTQFGSVPTQDNSEEKSVEKSSPGAGVHEDKQSFDDCGYQEIVVENPDKTKTVIIIPLECVDEPIDSVCDPTHKNPADSYVVDSTETISL